MKTNTIARAEAAELSIGALSRRTGCNIETIRFYERIGVMPEPARSEGGQRRYGEAHLRRLAFIRRSRALGFSLETVRTLLSFADGSTQTCENVKSVALDQLDETRRKIADLRKIERVLADLAAECSGGSVPDCPIIDALFDGRRTAS